jgi:hypothetical protein
MFFVQDRGGWSFLGRYDLGGDRISWLVTGVNPLSSPTLSPDGRTIAYFRWPPREHSMAYDRYEDQAVSLEAVDVATGKITQLWNSAAKAGMQTRDDDPSGLRWADDRTIIFRAEPDGWARLYAVGLAGGPLTALSPPNCEVAESALVAPDRLFVIHNCSNLDTRQIFTVDVRTGAERPIMSEDIVVANAAATGEGRWVAYSGAGPDQPLMLRIFDLRSAKLVFHDRADSNATHISSALRRRRSSISTRRTGYRFQDKYSCRADQACIPRSSSPMAARSNKCSQLSITRGTTPTTMR